MFGFDESRDAHQEVYGSGGYENQAKFSHELIAGAAAFEGMKQWEDHQRKEGMARPSFFILSTLSPHLFPRPSSPLPRTLHHPYFPSYITPS